MMKFCGTFFIATIIFFIATIFILTFIFFGLFYNSILIFFVYSSIVSGLFICIKLDKLKLKKAIFALILLITLWISYYINPVFNFWLTSSLRQSVVNKISYGPIPEGAEVPMDDTEHLFLGKATAYVYPDYKSIYFDYYRTIFTSAFIIYTNNPDGIGKQTTYRESKKLKENWFFLVRTYAD